jgi:soluble lytic murein transglycosylase-like protein
MKRYLTVLLFVATLCCCSQAQASTSSERDQAEYYVSAFAQHYGVPLALVRSVVQQESAWHVCTTSPKGAVGLMQLMPQTAKRLGVTNRCDIRENVSGGVRYLAWLIRLFQGDLRLVAAAYYAGEQVVAKRGLSYGNPDVVAYVAHVRALYRQNVRELPQLALLSQTKNR